ncbi:MAG TPA: hypothetical protein VGE10_11160 [Zeimonas sp.]
MRQEQFEALQKRAEELLDVFLEESNPAEWPGAGIKPAQMSRDTRGDLYWCKKNAVATLACAQRIIGLVDVARAKSAAGEDNPGAVTDGEDELEQEVAAAEKEAAALMDEIQRKARKAAFDKHVHGRKA